MNLGRSSANCSTNSFKSCCPAFLPCGSVTFKSLFLPLRSTTKPFDITICKFGGITDPSLSACEGRERSPPSAQAIASSTEVLPWLFLPPMMVNPFSVGSIFTALTRFTFSISSLLIFMFMLQTPSESLIIKVVFYFLILFWSSCCSNSGGSFFIVWYSLGLFRPLPFPHPYGLRPRCMAALRVPFLRLLIVSPPF